MVEFDPRLLLEVGLPVAGVLIAVLWFNIKMNGEIKVLHEKLDNLEARVNEHMAEARDDHATLQSAREDIARIKGHLGLNGRHEK